MRRHTIAGTANKLIRFSITAAEYSKEFTISAVLGKDVVPRIGLHQMEAMRADVINAIKRSVDSKVSKELKVVCSSLVFDDFSGR